MKRSVLAVGLMGGLAALTMTVVPAAADAQHYYGGGYGYSRGYDRGGYDRGGYDDRGYYGRGGYYAGDRGAYGYRHRCHDGTGGAILGAVAGGLLGNAVAGRGDRGPGTVIGGGLGALAGNAIARDC
jgi:hypothetical protein